MKKRNSNFPMVIFGRIFAGFGFFFILVGLVFRTLMRASDLDARIFLLTFVSIGSCFFIVGAIVLFLVKREENRIARLRAEGNCYDATIVDAYHNMSATMNYMHPLIIECSYIDKFGTSYLVKSKNIWEGNVMLNPDTIKVKVWVNPCNPKDYYVGIDQASSEGKYDYDLR